VLNYWQAIDEARKLARRQPGDDANESRPLTVAEAIDLYARDLAARGGDDYNAQRSRIHLPGSILSKPVGLLRATELCKWRDGLIEKGLARDTVNRIRTCVRAALTLAAKRDKRITNRHVWEDDLEALPNATMARNVVLADDVVGKLVTTAYARDRKLGLLCDVVSTTGARPSQAVRLLVADLDLADRSAPQLLMPRSGKGHANKRAAKMAERVRVQITPKLAALLKQEAKGRAGDAPLLMRGKSTRSTTRASCPAGSRSAMSSIWFRRQRAMRPQDTTFILRPVPCARGCADRAAASSTSLISAGFRFPPLRRRFNGDQRDREGPGEHPGLSTA
jgi:integrase